MLVPYYFVYYNLVVYFEIRQRDALSFALLAQDCFGCLGVFVIPYNLKIFFFSISVNNTIV